jgi:hypothetical protein
MAAIPVILATEVTVHHHRLSLKELDFGQVRDQAEDYGLRLRLWRTCSQLEGPTTGYNKEKGYKACYARGVQVRR